MTTAELIQYYVDLLIMEYKGKDRARSTIEAVVGPVLADQIYTQVRDGFDLETAVGVQLDVLGTIVGVSRSGLTRDGFVTLNDADFRSLIKFGIIRNASGSSLAEIVDLLWRFFPYKIQVFDYASMRMSFLVRADIGSTYLIDLVIAQGLLPVPMAVEISTTIYAPTIDSFYGFRTYLLPPVNRSPFNTYADYKLTYPWLSYGSANFAGESIGTEDGDTLITEDGDTIIT